jgi:hypothetical protein
MTLPLVVNFSPDSGFVNPSGRRYRTAESNYAPRRTHDSDYSRFSRDCAEALIGQEPGGIRQTDRQSDYRKNFQHEIEIRTGKRRSGLRPGRAFTGDSAALSPICLCCSFVARAGKRNRQIGGRRPRPR